MPVAYEPIYRAGQQVADNAFVPLDVSDNNRPAWREFSILVSLYRRGVHLQHRKTGVFSPKFGLKSKLQGADLLAFARRHPEADVCIVNTFPSIPYWSLNVWMQGEGVHPGLTQTAQQLLDAVGIPWNLAKVGRQGHGVVCYSNFWLGAPKFWDAYVGGVLMPIAEFLDANPAHPAAVAVMADTDHTDRAPFLPFVVERLFSTFLTFHPEVKVAAYPIGPDHALDYCLTEFERDLVMYSKPLVDKADAEGVMPDELARLMATFSKIHQRYILAEFAQKPNPHSGKPYNATS